MTVTQAKQRADWYDVPALPQQWCGSLYLGAKDRIPVLI
jgi:hypothetical protein